MDLRLRSPIDKQVEILKYDKFGVKRPASIVGKEFANIPHSGVDLRPHQYGGTKKVYAIVSGTVTINTASDGSYIQIAHSYGYRANYVHLTKRLVKVGEKVKKGQIIGEYSSHLHFTLFKDNIKVNPEKYIDMTTPTYKDINFKILEDFSDPKNKKNDVFGSRTKDYKALENKTPGAGIRERINVLIHQIRELEKAVEMKGSDDVPDKNSSDPDIIEVLEGQDSLIDSLKDELQNRDKEIQNLITKMIESGSKHESFSFNKFFVGLARDGVLEGALALVVSVLLALNDQPEFAQYSMYIGLGVTALKSFGNNIIKKLKQ